MLSHCFINNTSRKTKFFRVMLVSNRHSHLFVCSILDIFIDRLCKWDIKWAKWSYPITLAMYKIRNTGTGNEMRGTRGMGGILYSRKYRQTFQGMFLNIPGNIAKHSRSVLKTFQGIPANILGNVVDFWCEWRELLGRVAFRILSNIHDGTLLRK